MQRNWRYLLLGAIPFLGLAGAVAAGYVSPTWQPWQWSVGSKTAETNSAVKKLAEKVVSQSAAAAKSVESTSGNTQSTKTKSTNAESKATATSQTASARTATTNAAPPKKTGNFGIDVARLSPEGSSVIAGYAKPGARITVMANGKPVGAVTADQSGDWVLITPHKFATLNPTLGVKPGDHVPKKVAALEPARPARTAGSKRTAAQVTEQMLTRLRRLTKEAESQSPSAADAPQSLSAAGQQQRAIDNRPSSQGSVSVESGRTARPEIETKDEPVRSAAAAQTDSSQSNSSQPASSKPSIVTGSLLTDKKIKAPDAARSATSGSQYVAAAPATQAVPAKRAESLPVPVQFVYREATFTVQGREAAALLLKYFKAKKFRAVSLSGHADERGSPDANQLLSRQRLESIESYLRDGGFTGELTLVPKGEGEKYTGVDRSKFDQEELYQLDRRVEVVATR